VQRIAFQENKPGCYRKVNANDLRYQWRQSGHSRSRRNAGSSLADLLKSSDTDEDGAITESELATFLEQLESERQAKVGGPPTANTAYASGQCPNCGGYDQAGEGTTTSLSGQFSVLA
jgi:hypothetical protein